MFKDREEAGKLLGEELQMHTFDNPLVIAIPRGGVEVGYQVATKLEFDFTVAIAKKLRCPKNPESAFGAIAEDGSLYLNSRFTSPITREEIESGMKEAKNEVQKRLRIYRRNSPLPDINGRTIILADDGMATGSTLMAVIELCKKKNPGKIVVAVPVCSSNLYENLSGKVDQMVVLNISEPFYAVPQAYKKYPELTDAEAVKYLKLWNARKSLIESLSVYN